MGAAFHGMFYELSADGWQPHSVSLLMAARRSILTTFVGCDYARPDYPTETFP